MAVAGAAVLPMAMSNHFVCVPCVHPWQEVVVVDTACCDLEYKYGPSRRHEPSEVSVQKAVWARTRMSVAEKVHDTLVWAARWPLMLLRVREEERRIVADSEKVRKKMTGMMYKRLPVKKKTVHAVRPQGEHDAGHAIFDVDSDDTVDEAAKGLVPMRKIPALRRRVAGRGVGR